MRNWKRILGLVACLSLDSLTGAAPAGEVDSLSAAANCSHQKVQKSVPESERAGGFSILGSIPYRNGSVLGKYSIEPPASTSLNQIYCHLPSDGNRRHFKKMKQLYFFARGRICDASICFRALNGQNGPIAEVCGPTKTIAGSDPGPVTILSPPTALSNAFQLATNIIPPAAYLKFRFCSPATDSVIDGYGVVWGD